MEEQRFWKRVSQDKVNKLLVKYAIRFCIDSNPRFPSLSFSTLFISVLLTQDIRTGGSTDMCNPRSGNGVFLSDISRPSRHDGVYTNSQNTPVQKHHHNCDLTCQLLRVIRMRPAGKAVYYLDRLVGDSGMGPHFLSRQTPFHYFLDRTHSVGLNESCSSQE
jgi:hypothetical protein